jgi:hypothetical protein
MQGIRRYQIVALLVGVALASVACWNPFAPSAPTTTVVVQQSVTQTQGGTSASPAPNASPSPGSGAVGQVRVGAFGDERCPSGTQPTSNGDTGGVGCREDITCTPKLLGCTETDSTDCDAVAPLLIRAPDSFSIISGAECARLEPAGITPFNQVLVFTAACTAVVDCGVNGVHGQKAFTGVQ